MPNVCGTCVNQYNDDYFSRIICQLADIAFTPITYGCLSQLLLWAKAKKQQQCSKSAVGNTDEISTDLTGIVHTVVNTRKPSYR